MARREYRLDVYGAPKGKGALCIAAPVVAMAAFTAAAWAFPEHATAVTAAGSAAVFCSTYLLLRDRPRPLEPVAVAIDSDTGVVKVEAPGRAWAAAKPAVRASADGTALVLDMAKCAAQADHGAASMSDVRLRFELPPASAPTAAALIRALDRG